MEKVELGRQTVPASQLDTQTVAERASMPGYQLVKADNQPIGGKLVFRSVIKEGERWELQRGEVLIDPEKPMVIVGKL